MHYGKLPWHIAKGLVELRSRIDKAKIPSSKLDESLNIATWNIREFGKVGRLRASIHYIAEIINQFDLVALTELRDNLSDLARVMDLLGKSWEVVFSDFNDDAGGNRERIGYLFDTRMVSFTGLAAEADAPRKKNKVSGEYETKYDWWRSPYMASFRSGNFDFVALTAHMRWGSRIDQRVRALANFRNWVVKRRKNRHAVDSDFIVMGDFNVPNRRHDAYAALTGDGKDLLLPNGLTNIKGTNLSQRNAYDQILHSPTPVSRFSGKGGVLNFLEGGWKSLYPNTSHRPSSDGNFTYEMSDHFPLWLQVETDMMDDRLQMMADSRRRR